MLQNKSYEQPGMRGLVQRLLHMEGKPRNNHVGMNEARCVLLASHCAVQHDLDMRPQFLDETLRRHCYDAGCSVSFAYIRLAHGHVARRLPRYTVVPTVHALRHLIDLISEYGINIRSCQCYGDEDYIGKVCNTTASTHRLDMLARAIRRLATLMSLQM